MRKPKEIMEFLASPKEIGPIVQKAMEQVFEGSLDESRVKEWLEGQAADKMDKILQEAYIHLATVEGAICIATAIEMNKNLFGPWEKDIRAARRLLLTAAIQNGASVLKEEAEK